MIPSPAETPLLAPTLPLSLLPMQSSTLSAVADTISRQRWPLAGAATDAVQGAFPDITEIAAERCLRLAPKAPPPLNTLFYEAVFSAYI